MNRKRKFAVVLSGCGYLDGSEIHESIMTLLAIKQSGGEYQCFAPDIKQHHVVDHISGREEPESRNVLKEAARIARGNIKPLAAFKAAEFDALVFPGGYGAAKNLSSFAFEGADCKVNKDAEKAIRAMHQSGKPIGVLCISPVLIAKTLGEVKLTVGQDEDVNKLLGTLGATMVNTSHGEVVVDAKNRVVSTPCYMLESSIDQIYDGARNLIKAVNDLIK